MKPTPTPSSAEPVTPQDAAAPTTQDAHPVPVLPSADLLRGQKAVAIDHNGSLYRLQTTRQGKLILTK
jgi:hemin uptake protein HemP